MNDFSCIIEKKSRTNHTNIYFSIIFLLTDHIEFIMETIISISNKFDTKITWGREFLMRSFRILWYTDNLYTELGEFSLQSSKVLGLESTAWSIILWIKVEKCKWGFWEEGSEVHNLIFKDISCFSCFLSINLSKPYIYMSFYNKLYVHNSVNKWS